MTRRVLPAINALERPANLDTHLPPEVLDRWRPSQRAAKPRAGAAATIDIYETIGSDPWSGGGVTLKDIKAQLAAIGTNPVTVNINSPGGDYFEGVAIYEMLRAHPESVAVNVVGMAASAASTIAMAGDTIAISKAGSLMIHNAWMMAIGDRHAMQQAVALLSPLDAAMGAVYAERSGAKPEQIAQWMDATTWFTGQDAIDNGFAETLLEPDAAIAAAADGDPVNAVRVVDALLAQAGMTRAKRRDLLNQIKLGGHTPGGTQDAAAHQATQDAGLNELAAAMARLTQTIKN